MYRREVLAVLGAGTAGLAGCSLNQRDENTTPTPTRSMGAGTTPTASPTATPAPDRDVKVELATLTPGYVELAVDDWMLISEPDTQYAFFEIEIDSGLPPALSDFVFRFDGTDYAPLPREETTRIVRARDASLLSDDRYPMGWMVFELPETGDPSDIELTWPSAGAHEAWHPDGRKREQLAAPLPSLSLEAWHAPEIVPSSRKAVTFEFVVSNETDRAGHFVGAIRAPGLPDHNPMTVVEFGVGPNTATEWSVVTRHGLMPVEDREQFYELLWFGGGPVKRPARYVAG